MHNVATLTIRLHRVTILTAVRTKDVRMYHIHIVRSPRRKEKCTRDRIVDWKELRSLRSLPDRHVADPEIVEARFCYLQAPSRPACVLTGLRQTTPAPFFHSNARVSSKPTLEEERFRLNRRRPSRNGRLSNLTTASLVLRRGVAGWRINCACLQEGHG